jgi:spermidine/putrescine transport system permease protein|tara:strand:+ start:1220 stop:2224 length:1005 start_codon:yes stop_codon:yes gene_type:complete
MPGGASPSGIMLLAHDDLAVYKARRYKDLSFMSRSATSSPGFGLRLRRRFLASEALRGFSLLSPTLLAMVFGLAMPLLVLFTLSFWLQDYVDFIKTFSWKNYADFFDKPIYGMILFKSIKISGMVTLATVLLAYPMAYFIAFRIKTNKLVWLILITVPFWTSYLLRVFAWKLMLGYNGVVNSGLKSIGLISEPLEFLLYNPTAVTITLAHAWAAFAILPIYVSLEKIDRSLLEAARDLGENAFMTFVRVTLPLSLPGVIAASLLVFIPTVGDYVTPSLVGGPSGIMIGNIIQSMFGKAFNWPLGAAISVMVMFTITAMVCAFLWGTHQFRRRVA